MAIGRINATLTGVQPGGLAKIVPTSISVGSGSGSVDSNGNITFSGSSSVSINGCFTSSYDNYQIVIDYVNSTEDVLRMRMRVSGSDNSSANYGLARFNFRSGGSSTAGGHTETDWIVGGSGNSRKANASINLFSPFLSTNTTFNSLTANSNGTFMYGDVLTGNMSVTTSYTGFTLFTGVSTTGTVRIYGYN